MVPLVRRLLIILALMVWPGGLLFYAAVVVPVGADLLGSHTEQGFITQRVTLYVNGASVVTLTVLAYDILGSRRFSRGWQWRWSSWLVAATATVGLHGLHGSLDQLLDMEHRAVLDDVRFYAEHRKYLWITMVQVAALFVNVALMIGDWQHHDRDSNASRES